MRSYLLYIIIPLLLHVNMKGSEPLSYTLNIKIDNASRKELYQYALDWVNSSMPTYQLDVIKSDSINYIIACAGELTYNPSYYRGAAEGKISYKIMINLTYGVCEIVLDDFIHVTTSKDNNWSFGLITTDKKCPYKMQFPRAWSTKYWKDIKKRIANDINILLIEFKSYMDLQQKVE